MTPATFFAGRAVALFGLGGSGLATALALKAGGARVVAWDDSAAQVEAAGRQGIETGDLRQADWSHFAALVLSPGVPLTHPEPHWSAKLAKDAGVEIIGDIELFCRERAKIAPEAPFIAVTGTNGKSTTTALVAHILRAAGKDVQMGGNIGTAILSLEPPANDRVHVIECSSFQIDLAPSLKPTIGVLLNISPDHLDRHGTMENYAAIKERLVRDAAIAVVCIDDQKGEEIEEGLRRSGRHVISAATTTDCADFFIRSVSLLSPGAVEVARWERKQGWLAPLVNEGPAGRPVSVANLSAIPTLRGSHNHQNACAAAAVAMALGVGKDVLQAALRSFPGLPHRMEEVARRGRALFVNDSKATNADSTEKALASFDRILWILGGKPKEGGIESLRPYFSKIDKAYLIGEAAEEFAGTLEGEAPYERCGTLENAVAQAAKDAAASTADEPVVLLSPACASYDQFKNFEVRGNRFRDLVLALPGIEVKGA
jgi:UDP-N-acetylmuramoylalanine--D-glutamate ligase